MLLLLSNDLKKTGMHSQDRCPKLQILVGTLRSKCGGGLGKFSKADLQPNCSTHVHYLCALSMLTGNKNY